MMGRGRMVRLLAVAVALLFAVACGGRQGTLPSGSAEQAAAADGAAQDEAVSGGETLTGDVPAEPGVDADGVPVAPGEDPQPGPADDDGGAPAPPPGQPGRVPGAAGSTLFGAKEDRVGISDNAITLCAHAALTYGPAFNTTDADLNVYWQALNEEKGGVHGRKVTVAFENDNYEGPEAVAAAERCKAKNPFFLIGGIGFDQIPAVRDWAKRNKMLYIHHTATVQGSDGNPYAFTGKPTTEKTGEMFAELALKKFANKKIAILGRDSDNWMPGVEAFKRVAGGRLNIVDEIYTPKNQHNYTAEVLRLKNKNVDVIWAWESALAQAEMIQQAKSQAFEPVWMVFPFNLITQTLGDQALDPPLVGVAMFNAYSMGDYSGPFAQYAGDIKEFERQYRKYRPNADLSGVGGDLLFLAWQDYKAVHGLLDACGRDCTRNRLIDTIRSTNVPANGAACGADFTRPGNSQRGGWQLSIMEAYRAPSGKVNFRNTATCVEHLS